jgi:hypothetical protein
MKTLTALLTAALLSSATAANEELVDRPVGAFGRKFIHRDGTYTLSAKQGDKTTIIEETYNKANVMRYKRIFQTDTQGRLRNGVIYDGRKNALGSILFGYDPKTDRIIEERQFDKKGRLIRRIFYPGAIKPGPGVDPRLVNQGFALVYDPDRPQAKPVQEAAPATPTAPVTSEQDEFTPGIPMGRAAPSSSGEPVPMPEPKAGDTPDANGAKRTDQKKPKRFFGPR